MPIKTLVMLALGLALLYGLFTVGAPFLLAIVVAVFLETPVRLLMRAGRINRIAAATVACTLFTVALLGIVYWIGFNIVMQVIEFSKKAPRYFEGARAYIQDAVDRMTVFFGTLSPDLADQAEKGLKNALDALTNSLNTVIGGVSRVSLDIAAAIPNMLIFFIVFLVALYLFSYSFPSLRLSFLTLFEEKSRHKVDEVLINLRKSIFGFLRAQILLSTLTYIVTLAGLLVLRVEYPMAIALLIVIVDILPILGTGSVLVPWAIYCFITGNIFHGIGLIVLFIFITVFRRIVEPKVLGDSVGISTLSALVSLYVGFEFVGVVGLFLGPTVVIIYQAMRKAGLLQFKIRLE